MIRHVSAGAARARDITERAQGQPGLPIEWIPEEILMFRLGKFYIWHEDFTGLRPGDEYHVALTAVRRTGWTNLHHNRNQRKPELPIAELTEEERSEFVAAVMADGARCLKRYRESDGIEAAQAWAAFLSMKWLLPSSSERQEYLASAS